MFAKPLPGLEMTNANGQGQREKKMDKLELKSEPRDSSRGLNRLRKQGKLPAVLYGHNIKNQGIMLNLADFEKVLKKAGESTVINLATGDGKTHPVLIHDVQNHYLTSKPIHVDFYEVSMTEKLKAEVSLEYTGESKAVKELGGVLVKVLNIVQVQCLAADLPHNIEVDITKLQTFTDTIHVRDLIIPAKVEMITPGEETVVKVQPPRDVEKELSAETPVEDVSAVVGAAETPAQGAEETKEAKKEVKKE
jgi:large subunit ribosomal protein L25